MYRLLINTPQPKKVIRSPFRIVLTEEQQNQHSPSKMTQPDAPLLTKETTGNMFLYKFYNKDPKHLNEDLTQDIYPEHLQVKTQALLIANIEKPEFVELMKALEQRKDNIDLVQLVNEQKNAIHVIVYFRTLLISEEFYGMLLDNHKFFVLYIQEVLIVNKEKHLELEKELLSQVNSFQLQEKEAPNLIEKQTKQFIELPKCLLCLNKLEYDISGLPKRVTGDKKLIGSQSPCLTCQTVEKYPAGLRCEQCESDEDLWICMVCSKVGCGRYKKADAFKHYQTTNHIITMDLSTQRIWNYQSDCFSHRIVPINERQSTLKFPDYSGKKPNQLYQEAVESAFWEYCSLVSEELERQRVFYGKEKAKQEEHFQKESIAVEKALLEVEKEIDCKTHEVKKLVKKNKKLIKRLGELKQKNNEDRQLLSNYDRMIHENSQEINIAELEQNHPKIQEKLKILEKLQTQISVTLLKLTE